MVDAKVDPETIRAYIKASPMAYDLSVSEIIALKEQGVSADLLTGMLQHGSELRSQAPLANPGAAASPPYPGAAGPNPQTPVYPYDSGATPTYSDSGYAYAGYPSSYSYPYYSYYYGYAYPWAFYSPFFVGFNFRHSHFNNFRFHSRFPFPNHIHRFAPFHTFGRSPAAFPRSTSPFAPVRTFASRPSSFAFHGGTFGMARAGGMGSMGGMRSMGGRGARR